MPRLKKRNERERDRAVDSRGRKTRGGKRRPVKPAPKKAPVKKAVIKKAPPPPATPAKPPQLEVPATPTYMDTQPITPSPAVPSSPAPHPEPFTPPPGLGAPPAPPAVADPAPGLVVWDGDFGPRQAERLLWRAGFGPRPGQAEELAGRGLRGAVRALTRPGQEPAYDGPVPTVDGRPLSPREASGEDHLWWLDRMARTTDPLGERMALVFHDWFATSNATVGSEALMLAQYETLRAGGLGRFDDLLLAITTDPAMLLWLNGTSNQAGVPDENYAREMMELFTLGADRDAYTEQDIRELARALTGWCSDGYSNFRWESARFDSGRKTVFGQTGNWDWRDACRLCVEHPLHPSFFVQKLWSYFIPTPPSAGTLAALEELYVSGERQIRPVVEAILLHPDLHAGAPMVKPPVVFAAGLLRSIERGIQSRAWLWFCEAAGQRLFFPPDVSGWDDSRWIDTSTTRGRWLLVTEALVHTHVSGNSAQDLEETPDQAVARALAFWHNPLLSPETFEGLRAFAANCLPPAMADWEKHYYKIYRQNALRQLIAASPDGQVA